jgi:hypothetical protein
MVDRKIYMREWARANKGRKILYRHSWSPEKREAFNAKKRQWYADHPDKAKQSRRIKSGPMKRGTIQRVYEDNSEHDPWNM